MTSSKETKRDAVPPSIPAGSDEMPLAPPVLDFNMARWPQELLSALETLEKYGIVISGALTQIPDDRQEALTRQCVLDANAGLVSARFSLIRRALSALHLGLTDVGAYIWLEERLRAIEVAAKLAKSQGKRPSFLLFENPPHAPKRDSAHSRARLASIVGKHDDQIADGHGYPEWEDARTFQRDRENGEGAQAGLAKLELEERAKVKPRGRITGKIRFFQWADAK